MIRVAAVGDIHLGPDARGHLRPALERLPDHADLFLIAGDLTRLGTPEEAEVVAAEVSDVGVPVVAVLGNHDYHADSQDKIVAILDRVGVQVLDGGATEIDVAGTTVGIAGTKGFGGGFPGRCGSDFGEPQMKAFMRHSKQVADDLGTALSGVGGDVKIALTHYSPVADTLLGEPPEIHPFLGCYFLAEAIDQNDVALAVHGHAHFGCEKGVTPGGTRVRNVAQPVLGQAYAVYCLASDPGDVECPPDGGAPGGGTGQAST